MPQGGFQLAAFNSGPASGTGTLLASADKSVVLLNFSTALEIKRAVLTGKPVIQAVDNTHGTVIVGLADTTSGKTNFVKVDASTGTVTALGASVPFLATGLQTSLDGCRLYVVNRTTFQVLANQ